MSYNAEAVREVLLQLRTCFRPPKYVVDVLEAEMKERKLNILDYVQELFLRRHETLRDETPSRSGASEARERKRR